MVSESEQAVIDYRDTMAGYVVESLRMIQGLLAEADFETSFPRIFADPTDEAAEFSVHDECGLLLQKAKIHIVAVLGANDANNIHSMAIHMRIILECAAQMIWKARIAYDGSTEERLQVLNAFDYDYSYAMAKMSRGATTQEEIQDTINKSRKETGDENRKPPRRVRVTDNIKSLIDGEQWYSHLTRAFVHTTPDRLAGDFDTGGVLSPEGSVYTFGALLDYLAEHIIVMLVSYGSLTALENGDSRPFYEAVALFERKREATKAFDGLHQG